jgi:GH35 family endo-1,4-beta-xylanase
MSVWPKMDLTVDEERAADEVVDSTRLTKYEFSTSLRAGIRRITVRYTNNARAGPEDRNLYLDAIEIWPADPSHVIELGDPKVWQRDWRAQTAERDAKTLEEARKAIERVRKTDIVLEVVDGSGAPVPGAALSVRQTAHDFLFGCNIYGFDRYGSARENELYKQRFQDLFNYATTGFYWRSYEPEPGKPQYAETDKVVAWCLDHGIRLKGHPLLWDHEAGEPVWAGGQPNAIRQEQRVREIVSRYKGKIEFWEVVNEPAHVQGVKIDQPYRWARESDPTAHLIVNDYEVMANGYPPFFELLEEAIRNGVPFDGIGIQAHEPRTMRFPLHRVKATLDKYATLGKALHITEFTPTSAGNPITGSHIGGVWDEAAQAEYAVQFYTVCFAHPAVVAITWWDLSDAGSWLKGGGLLREDLTPKPVYTALHRLIHEEWKTRAVGVTDGRGRFPFRGSFGDFEATITTGGKAASKPFRIRPKSPSIVQLRVQ